MKQFWIRQVRRIDALSLRERVIMFSSLALALAGVFDALVLSPGIAEHQRLLQQMRSQADELATLRQRLAAARGAAQADTPQTRLLANLAEVERERAAMQVQIDALQSGGDRAAQLPALLERVLRRHERLELLKLATSTEPPRRGAAAARDASAAQARPALRGVDLGIRGPYLDLLRYVGELDAQLPGLRWGEVHLDAHAPPPTLQARVFLAAGEAR